MNNNSMQLTCLHGYHHSTVRTSFGGQVDSRAGGEEVAMATDGHLESIMKDIRAFGEVEHTFRVVQIGRAMLRRAPPSVANLQLILRDFYFNYRRFGSPAMSAEHLLTVSSRGLLFTSRDPSGEIEKVTSTRFGPEAIVQATAVRFTTKSDQPAVEGATKKAALTLDSTENQQLAGQVSGQQQQLQQKKPKLIRAQQALISAINAFTSRRKRHSKAISGRFCIIDKHQFSTSMFNAMTPAVAKSALTDPVIAFLSSASKQVNNNNDASASSLQQQGPQSPWFLIQPEFEFLSFLYHPPIVAFTLRRQHRIRCLDLHVFVCCSDSDAVQLVTFVTALCESGSRVREVPPTIASAANNSSRANNITSSNHTNHNNANKVADEINLSSVRDDASYYERMIVKEATSVVIEKMNTLGRKSAFVNPNVGLSPYGTLTTTAMAPGRKARASVHPNKLAMPFAVVSPQHQPTASPTTPQLAPAVVSSSMTNKPTIFDFVEHFKSKTATATATSPKMTSGLLKEATIAHPKLTTAASSNSNNRSPTTLSNVENDYNEDAVDSSEGSGVIKVERAEAIMVNISSSISTSSSTQHITPGELLPLPEITNHETLVESVGMVVKHQRRGQITDKNSCGVNNSSDDHHWSRSELSPTGDSTSSPVLLTTKKSMILGDVQTMLGYLP